MGDAWAETGEAALATRCRRLAATARAGAAAAVRGLSVRLPDGSLFLPVAAPRPGAPVRRAHRVASRQLLEPRRALRPRLRPLRPGQRARRRARSATCCCTARASSGSSAPAPTRSTVAARPIPTSGTDQVYGLNVARFLAAIDEPDQLVLSLYGQLAAAMTPGTFVAGEAASVTPLHGEYYRAMYLPPNGASNATFLGTLRLLLVHETVDARRRRPGWSSRTRRRAPGSRRASRSPSRGAHELRPRLLLDQVDAERGARVDRRPQPLSPPVAQPAAPACRVAYASPGSELDGRPFGRFDARTETIELPVRPGPIELVARLHRG